MRDASRGSLVPVDGAAVGATECGTMVQELGKERSRMIKRLYVALGALAGAATLSGCGNPAGYFPVSGKVVYKGEPASGAVVYFHRANEPPGSQQAIPFSIVGDDGSFHLACDGVGDGCPPGRYDVLVEWRGKPASDAPPPKATVAKGKTKQATPSRLMARQGVDRLKGRYFDIAKPILHAEVEARPNILPPFELED
jgi:hypothetical protein